MNSVALEIQIRNKDATIERQISAIEALQAHIRDMQKYIKQLESAMNDAIITNNATKYTTQRVAYGATHHATT